MLEGVKAGFGDAFKFCFYAFAVIMILFWTVLTVIFVPILFIMFLISKVLEVISTYFMKKIAIIWATILPKKEDENESNLD